MSLDYANKALYENAWKRDCQLWITNGWRSYRDALLAGRDGRTEWDELCRREHAVREVSEKRSTEERSEGT